MIALTYMYFFIIVCIETNVWHKTVLFSVLTTLLFNCIFTFSMKNPIHSLILLIFSYLMVGFLFVYFSFVFTGLIYMLIYVGAVSILLLFTIMLLDLRTLYYKAINKSFINYFSYFFILYILYTWIAYKEFYLKRSRQLLKEDLDWFSVIFLKSDVVNLSSEILVNNYDLVLILALLLTFILIGSTSAVNSVKSFKKQKQYNQLKKYNVKLLR